MREIKKIEGKDLLFTIDEGKYCDIIGNKALLLSFQNENSLLDYINKYVLIDKDYDTHDNITEERIKLSNAVKKYVFSFICLQYYANVNNVIFKDCITPLNKLHKPSVLSFPVYDEIDFSKIIDHIPAEDVYGFYDSLCRINEDQQRLSIWKIEGITDYEKNIVLNCVNKHNINCFAETLNSDKCMFSEASKYAEVFATIQYLYKSHNFNELNIKNISIELRNLMTILNPDIEDIMFGCFDKSSTSITQKIEYFKLNLAYFKFHILYSDLNKFVPIAKLNIIQHHDSMKYLENIEAKKVSINWDAFDVLYKFYKNRNRPGKDNDYFDFEKQKQMLSEALNNVQF